MMETRIVDMHCHLDFARDPALLVEQGGRRGVFFFSATCEPGAFPGIAGMGTQGAAVRAALGMHPWWVADGRVGEDDVLMFEQLAPRASAFGELGLDFDDRHTPATSHRRQIEVFERACRAIVETAQSREAVLPVTLHTHGAADEVLDILGETGCLDSCACIMHWFAGSDPQLRRAIDAGCWFSVNRRGLASRRGREYARRIPLDKLLVETDLPPERGWEGESPSDQADAMCTDLDAALGLLADNRGHGVSEVVLGNSLRLLNARCSAAS